MADIAILAKQIHLKYFIAISSMTFLISFMKQMDSAFLRRLETCAKRAGGKTSLAKATKISLPQLFRYLNGAATPPLPRLINIANAANTHLQWLINGEGNIEANPIKAVTPESGSLSINSEMLEEALSHAESLDREYNYAMTPATKARLVSAVYKAMHHESRLYENPPTFTKGRAMDVFAYLSAHKNEIPRKVISNTLEVMNKISSGILPSNEVLAFDNYVSTAVNKFYDHPSGQAYFDRINNVILKDSLKSFEDFIKATKQRHAYSSSPIKILDIGCGGGRHLKYFSKANGLQLHGIDTSERALKIAGQLEAANILPSKSIQYGDMRHIPHSDRSFDIVFAYNSIFHLPYFAEHPMGLNLMLSEVKRILKPGGYLYIRSRYGKGFEPFPFFQLHNEFSIGQAGRKFGFNLLNFEKDFQQTSILAISSRFNEWFAALLQT